MAKKPNTGNKLKKNYFATNTTKTTLWWILFILVTVVILATSVANPQLDIAEGEIAQEDVYYQGAIITYTSQVRTNQARTQAASQVEQLYLIDAQTEQDSLAYIDSIFGYIVAARSESIGENGADTRVERLRTSISGEYTDQALNQLLTMPNDELLSIRNALKNIVQEILLQGVMEEELANAVLGMEEQIDALELSEDISGFLKSLLSEVKANKEYDAIATAAELDRVMQGVEPIQVTVQPGEKLVSKGSLVAAEQYEALHSLGMLSSNIYYLPYFGLLILVCIFYLLLIFFINISHPVTGGRPSNIVLIGCIIVFTLLICKLVSMITISDRVEISSQVGYLLPVSMASMLICVLLGKGLAIFITTILAISVGVLMEGQLNFAIVAFAGGMMGVFHSVQINNRSQFVGASLYIGCANALTIGSLGLISGLDYSIIGAGMLLGLLNGAFSSVLAIGILPFIESVFGITTIVKLLELSNSNHPLLKRLMMEAPGTYHHSILVGNLAEAAASEVDADLLIVRVASYYHDIGKIRRPFFFVENQMRGDNPHDKLQPTLSTLIITSHVKDGVEMLKEHKMPYQIIDIAEQHHGTSVLSYFYHKAKENAEDPESIKKEDFSYLGPKPQTKEAALVMLADSVQAAVQSMVNPSKGHVEQKIRDIIKNKVSEGQLQECPLTFRDLDTIAQSFAKVLWGMHHTRIEYPEEVRKQIGRAANDHKNTAPKQTETSNQQSDSPSSTGGPDSPVALSVEQEAAGGDKPNLPG